MVFGTFSLKGEAQFSENRFETTLLFCIVSRRGMSYMERGKLHKAQKLNIIPL